MRRSSIAPVRSVGSSCRPIDGGDHDERDQVVDDGHRQQPDEQAGPAGRDQREHTEHERDMVDIAAANPCAPRRRPR
jgi:hypothetical protein